MPESAGESAVINGGAVTKNVSVTLDALNLANNVELLVSTGTDLDFTGAAPNNLVNRGILQASGGGILSPNECLIDNTGGTISFTPTPGTEHDVLDVQGSLALGGTLQVSLLGFAPAPTDTFTVITQGKGFGTLTGTFAGIADGQTLQTRDGGGTFVVSYNTASVTLSDFSLTPFGIWKQTHLGAAAFDPITGDPDLGAPNGDGIPVLLDYAFDTDPLANNQQANLPVTNIVSAGENTHPAIVFRRRTGGAHGLLYSARESSDLLGWSALDLGTNLVTTVDNGDGTETVTVRGSSPIGGTPGSRTFLQVGVSLGGTP